MSADKLVDSTQLDTDLASVASAIRTKGGTSASLAFPTGFVTAINAIPSGGSSWTKVAETSYQISTTSTSTATVATWATGDSSIWTSDQIVYVRIRDTAGKRVGYFYGSDQLLINYLPANGSGTSTTSIFRLTLRVNSSGAYAAQTFAGATGYGVFADYVYSDGRIRICSRYNSSTSLTINGTYKVEVYLLDPPTGAPIFT